MAVNPQAPKKEMLKLLLQESTTEVNALNECGCTPLDLLLQRPSDIGDMEVCELLLSSGSKKGRQVCSSLQQFAAPSSLQQFASPPKIRWAWKSMMPLGLNNSYKKEDAWLNDMRNTMMMVSTVIAGATFQSGLNPPKVENKKDSGYLISFVIFDVIALGAWMLIILSLVSGLPLKSRPMAWVLIVTLWVAVSSMALAFLMGANLLLCWLLLSAIMISYHIVVMLIQVMRWVLNSCNSCLGGDGNVV